MMAARRIMPVRPPWNGAADSPEAVLERVYPHLPPSFCVFHRAELSLPCLVTGQRLAHLADAPGNGWSTEVCQFLSAQLPASGFHEGTTLDICEKTDRSNQTTLARIGSYWYPRGGLPIDVLKGKLPGTSGCRRKAVRALSRQRLRKLGLKGASMSEMRDAIRNRAPSLADAAGFAPATLPDKPATTSWPIPASVLSRRHGLAGGQSRSPRRPVQPPAAAKSVIVLWLNHGPEGDPLVAGGAGISVIRNRDHTTHARALAHMAGRYSTEVKVSSIPHPLHGKPLAANAGTAGRGNTRPARARMGLWLFLGEVFTALEIAPDAPEVDHCEPAATASMPARTAYSAPYQLMRGAAFPTTTSIQGPIPSRCALGIGESIWLRRDCPPFVPWNSSQAAGG